MSHLCGMMCVKPNTTYKATVSTHADRTYVTASCYKATVTIVRTKTHKKRLFNLFFANLFFVYTFWRLLAFPRMQSTFALWTFPFNLSKNAKQRLGTLSSL